MAKVNCQVQKYFGLQTALLFLIIADLADSLHFLEEPQGIVIKEGATFQLKCKAQSSSSQKPVLRYTWLQNNAVIAVRQANGGTDGNLVVANSTKASDSGVYMCIASTQDSSITSKKAEVKYAEMSLPFTKKPSETEVFVGQKVTFYCSIRSVPLPVFQWHFNFERDTTSRCKVNVNKEESLCVIEKVRYEDSGHYFCDATNTVLQKRFRSGSGYLQVRGPPVFQASPKGKTVGRASTFTLACSSSSYPKASIVWILPSQKQINSTQGRYHLFSNGTLQISGTIMTDRGLYTCIVSNIHGKIQAQASVNIIDGLLAPVILSSPDQVTAVHGDQAILMTCTADGNPKPVISWQRIGGSLDLRRMSYPAPGMLRVAPVDRSDYGTYQCVATSTVGVATKRVQFIVKAPPIVTTSLEKQITGVLNQSMSFTCTVDAYPTAHVVWRLPNGTSVAVQSSVNARIKNYKIFLSSIKLSDEGDYRCVASNEVGTGIVEVNMNIHGPPRVVKNAKTYFAIIIGRRWTMKCPLEGPPKPSYTWTFNNSAAGHGQDLTFQKALKEHTGTYTCKGTNKYGSEDVVVNVSIASPPVSKVPSKMINIVEFSSINVSCIATGQPSPLVTWSNTNNTNLTKPSSVTSFLVLKNIKRNEQGTYYCHASNVVGTSTVSFYVNVLVLPYDVEVSKNVTVTQGGSITLQCSANGNEKPMLSWLVIYQNKSEHTLCNNCKSLALNNIHSSSMGLYICKATNTVGSTSAKVYVEVRFKPTFQTKRIKIFKRIGSHVKLYCDVKGNPKPIIHWVTPYGQWLSTPHLTFRHAMKNQTGVYTCVAENFLGVASQQIDFILEGPPVIYKLSTQNTSSNTVILQCMATGQPTPVLSWVWSDKASAASTEKTYTLQNGSALIIDRGYLQSNCVICLAQNKYGKQRLEISVPTRPTNVTIVPFDRRNVTIAWNTKLRSPLLPFQKHMFQYRMPFVSSHWTGVSLNGKSFAVNLTTKIYSVYEVRIAVKNEFGWSKYSAPVTFRSRAAEPSAVVDFKAQKLNASAVKLTWKEPLHLHGPRNDIHYQVSLRKKDKTAVSFLTKQRETVVLRLEAAVKYNATLAAGRQILGTMTWGKLAWTEFTMGSPVPVIVPDLIQLIQRGYSQLEVRWTIGQQPSTLTGYTIFFRRYGLDIGFQSLFVKNANSRNQVIGGLVPGTSYEVRISATSSGGSGPQSQSLFGKTAAETASSDAKLSVWIWVSIGTLAGIIFLLLLIVSVLLYKRKMPLRQDSMHPDDYLDEYKSKKRHFNLKFEDNKGIEFDDDIHIKKLGKEEDTNKDITFRFSEHMAREVDNPIFLVESRADAMVIGNRFENNYGPFAHEKEASPLSTITSKKLQYADTLRCGSTSPIESGNEEAGLY